MRLHLAALTLLAATSLVAAGADEAGPPRGRLGADVRPLAYRLDLKILPDQAEFSGVASIDVDIAAPTRVIHLHGNGLTVQSAAHIDGAGVSRAATWEQVDPTGVARLRFETPVPAGKGTLRLEYTGPFGKAGEGLYKSVIADEAYTFTQFQPIDARRMFPGFDEPGFKTPFDIAVTTRTANAVVGNTPVTSEQPGRRGPEAGAARHHAAAAHLPDRAGGGAARHRGGRAGAAERRPQGPAATPGRRDPRQGAAAALRAGEHPRPGPLPGGLLRRAVPLPQAGPHRLAGLRRRHGERRRHHLRRSAPAAGRRRVLRATAAASAASTPTSWPTSGSATW